MPESATFQAQHAGLDIAADLITGVMAIPLSVRITTMSDYPIKAGLADKQSAKAVASNYLVNPKKASTAS